MTKLVLVVILPEAFGLIVKPEVKSALLNRFYVVFEPFVVSEPLPELYVGRWAPKGLAVLHAPKSLTFSF